MWDTSWPALTLVLDQVYEHHDCLWPSEWVRQSPRDLENQHYNCLWPWVSVLRLTLTLSMSNTPAFDLRNDYYNYYCLWFWTWSSRLPFDLGHPHYDCLWLWKTELQLIAFNHGYQSFDRHFLDSVLWPMTKKCPRNGLGCIVSKNKLICSPDF